MNWQTTERKNGRVNSKNDTDTTGSRFYIRLLGGSGQDQTHKPMITQVCAHCRGLVFGFRMFASALNYCKPTLKFSRLPIASCNNWSCFLENLCPALSAQIVSE